MCPGAVVGGGVPNPTTGPNNPAPTYTPPPTTPGGPGGGGDGGGGAGPTCPAAPLCPACISSCASFDPVKCPGSSPHDQCVLNDGTCLRAWEEPIAKNDFNSTAVCVFGLAPALVRLPLAALLTSLLVSIGIGRVSAAW